MWTLWVEWSKDVGVSDCVRGVATKTKAVGATLLSFIALIIIVLLLGPDGDASMVRLVCIRFHCSLFDRVSSQIDTLLRTVSQSSEEQSSSPNIQQGGDDARPVPDGGLDVDDALSVPLPDDDDEINSPESHASSALDTVLESTNIPLSRPFEVLLASIIGNRIDVRDLAPLDDQMDFQSSAPDSASSASVCTSSGCTSDTVAADEDVLSDTSLHVRLAVENGQVKDTDVSAGHSLDTSFDEVCDDKEFLDSPSSSSLALADDSQIIISERASPCESDNVTPAQIPSSDYIVPFPSPPARPVSELPIDIERPRRFGNGEADEELRTGAVVRTEGMNRAIASSRRYISGLSAAVVDRERGRLGGGGGDGNGTI